MDNKKLVSNQFREYNESLGYIKNIILGVITIIVSVLFVCLFRWYQYLKVKKK